MKRLGLAVVVGLLLGLLFDSYAYSDQPGAEPHGPKHEDCHGANEVDCRPDPQPEHGNDCVRSDDHVCPITASTTTTVPPLTTTTTAPPTTTTTTPTTGPTSTTTIPPGLSTPTTTVLTVPHCSPTCITSAPSTVDPGESGQTPVGTEPVTTSPKPTPPTTELAHTGNGWLWKLGLGLVLFGLVPILIGKLIKGV